MEQKELGKVLFIPEEEIASFISKGIPVSDKNIPWRTFELNGGIGKITAMCNCGEFLEIYKIDKTFQVTSTRSVNPKETNKNEMWTAFPVADVGSGNPIIARVLLQGQEILKAAVFDRKIDKEVIIRQLHSCKELLLANENITHKISASIDSIIYQINSNDLPMDGNGRVINPFPQVPDLDAQCSAYLIQANKVIKLICELPRLFISLERVDSNFDHLGNRLEKVLGNNSQLTVFVRKHADGIRHIVELRNYYEHPQKRKRTIIDNFHLLPGSGIQVPVWHLSDDVPRSIKEEMIAANLYLRDVVETMLILLVMHCVTRKIPYVILIGTADQIDKKVPIKYRLSLDVSKLKIAKNKHS